MRRLTRSLLLLPFVIAMGMLPLSFPSSAPRAAGVTLTPTVWVYLPIIARPYPNESCRAYSGYVQVCAGVSDSSPNQDSIVTVYGRLTDMGTSVAGAPMHTIWHYKTTTQIEDCTTGLDGIGSCSRNIAKATKGYPVQVDVTITYNGSSYGATTFFTPR
jgi:hypothetical protein